MGLRQGRVQIESQGYGMAASLCILQEKWSVWFIVQGYFTATNADVNATNIKYYLALIGSIRVHTSMHGVRTAGEGSRCLSHGGHEQSEHV